MQSGNDRKRDTREERRRSQNPVVPPSPALVRHGSKSRKIPNALIPGTTGQQTPQSAAAQVNVSAATPRGTHPYANAANGGFEGYDVANASFNTQQYPRTSPMTPNAGTVPPAVSQVRAQAGPTGVSVGQDMDEPPRKNTLLRILTCSC
jgi:casein kinase 1